MKDIKMWEEGIHRDSYQMHTPSGSQRETEGSAQREHRNRHVADATSLPALLVPAGLSRCRPLAVHLPWSARAEPRMAG